MRDRLDDLKHEREHLEQGDWRSVQATLVRCAIALIEELRASQNMRNRKRLPRPSMFAGDNPNPPPPGPPPIVQTRPEKKP